MNACSLFERERKKERKKKVKLVCTKPADTTSVCMHTKTMQCILFKRPYHSKMNCSWIQKYEQNTVQSSSHCSQNPHIFSICLTKSTQLAVFLAIVRHFMISGPIEIIGLLGQ